MDDRGTYKSGTTTGGKVGCAVAAILGIALAFVVTGLAWLSCPRDGDCQSEAQLLFWGGLLVASTVAGGVGWLVRLLVNRRFARRDLD